MKKQLIFTVIFFQFCFLVTEGQDVEWSQFYAAPLHLNPALTGVNAYPRIILNYRNQWPNFHHAYTIYAASYDQDIDKLNGGIGLMVLADRAGNGVYNATIMSGTYAYKIQVNKKYAIRIGVQPSFTQRNIDWNQLSFSDMIDKRYGFVNTTGQIPPERFLVSYFDAGAGFFIYSRKLYGGLGVKHLLRPNENLSASKESRIPVRVAVHAGAITFLDKSYRPKSYLSPNIMFVRQAGYHQLSVGSYIGKEAIFAGVWIRHDFSNFDALIALIGLNKKFFKIGYSYDVTLSQLTPGTGGAHELSITFKLGKGDDITGEGSGGSKNQKTIECPKIF